jgi:hypothetical protein
MSFLRYLLSIAFIFFSVSAGMCCSCILSSQTEREEALLKINESAYIFEAKVLSDSLTLETPESLQHFEFYNHPRVFSMQVRKAYKGELPRNITIETAASGAQCGEEFEVGKRYLVFASLVDDKLSTGLCSGNTPMAFAGAESRALRNEPPAPEDLLPPQVYAMFSRERNLAVVCGKIQGEEMASVEDYQPIHVGFFSWSAEYEGWDEGDSDVYVPAAGGRYCYLAKPGKYLITTSSQTINGCRLAAYYPGTLVFKEARLVTLQRGEIRQNFDLKVFSQKMGTVKVTVNLSADHDVRWLEVTDLAQDPLNNRSSESKSDTNDRNIVLENVPEGMHIFQAQIAGSNGLVINGTPVKFRTNGQSQELTLIVP